VRTLDGESPAMTQVNPSDRRTTRTAGLGIGIAIGAVVLLVVGVFALRVYQADQAWSAFVRGGPTFAAGWIEDVRAGRLDAAYRATTAAYRARVDRAAFDRWVADHPELKLTPEPRSFSMSKRVTGFTIGWNGLGFFDASKRLTYRTALRPDGKAPSLLTIAVTPEGGSPVVDQAEIEPEP
jgi:hypothetical protein